MNKHLTIDEIEQYAEKELDAARLDEIDQHLAACPACRARVAQDNRMSDALRALPRTQPPHELAARIGTIIETRSAQERARRASVPWIALATLVSILLAGWFCAELALAFEVNGVLDFWSLFTSYSDLLSPDSLDTLFALLEALPIAEIFLTLCALLTVGVLAQQLVDALRPRLWQFR